MNELAFAQIKRRAEKRLRAQGLSRRLAAQAVARLDAAQLRKLGRRSLIDVLRGAP